MSDLNPLGLWYDVVLVEDLSSASDRGLKGLSYDLAVRVVKAYQGVQALAISTQRGSRGRYVMSNWRGKNFSRYWDYEMSEGAV